MNRATNAVTNRLRNKGVIVPTNESRNERANFTTIQLRDRGIITLPMEARRRHGLQTGDVLSLVDIGRGIFILSSIRSRVVEQGDLVADILQTEGVALEDLLRNLDEERTHYYREHYVDA